MYGDRTGKTIRDATEEWVNGFDRVPYGVLEKLLKADCEYLHEITPPAAGDTVYIYGGNYSGEYGEIVRCSDDDDDVYIVRREGKKRGVRIETRDFEVQRDGYLPMWGTLWSFGDSADDYWLEECGGLQKMADCGFRIYENEDYGYVFGIDGAGYSFFEAHWMPLYKARGLRWHDPATEDTLDDIIKKLKKAVGTWNGSEQLIETLVALQPHDDGIRIGGYHGGFIPDDMAKRLEGTGHFHSQLISETVQEMSHREENRYWLITRTV